MKWDMWTALSLLIVYQSAAIAQTDTSFFRIAVPAETFITGLDADGTLTWTGSVVDVTGTVQRTSASMAESTWTDFVRFSQTGAANRIRVLHPNTPLGMAFVPAGGFQMGDSMGDGGTTGNPELPLHTVFVSAFFIDKCEVTKSKWDEVYSWAVTHGYNFDNVGAGKASNHPVQNVSWYDSAKWCNARSEMEGLTPCYTVGGTVWKLNTPMPACVWTANGYRLPTEAEWEKAARGGAHGERFPWTDFAWIKHSRANYMATTNHVYDASPTLGYHPFYKTGDTPYTSPVGSFPPNAYGLCDVAGNVYEWCWDWYSQTYYDVSPTVDPSGPESSLWGRVVRGGSWTQVASAQRCACRGVGSTSFTTGFRCVRRP